MEGRGPQGGQAVAERAGDVTEPGVVAVPEPQHRHADALQLPRLLRLAPEYTSLCLSATRIRPVSDVQAEENINRIRPVRSQTARMHCLA